MNYQESYNFIVKNMKERGQLQHMSDFSNFNDADYNKTMDIINFLMSRCILRYGLQGYSEFTTCITWTRLGIEQLNDEQKSSILLSEFKRLYAIENEE